MVFVRWRNCVWARIYSLTATGALYLAAIMLCWQTTYAQGAHVGEASKTVAEPGEVTIGAQAWSYDRVYPLLDGLLQDVANTGVAPLVLNPNTPNATQLNALVQSFQLQAGYNQLAGVQNSAAAQMAVSNLGLQTTLNQQEESILAQALQVQQQLVQEQQIASNPTTPAAQIAAAQQQVTSLTNQLTAYTAELSDIQKQTPWNATPSSSTITPSITAPAASLVPSAVQSAALPSSSSPSFPATKQLDNQMDLLWSRLARVVGTMARPNTIDPKDQLFLVEFDTGTFPKNDKKDKILDTDYLLTCGNDVDPRPTVVDIFPRAAAVNVNNTYYRDAGLNIGAVLAWFGFGINAGYNREHLQLSQALGQSSYITGYGVGQSEFGWEFGIPLGTQYVSSDIKRTFVLVRVPATGCTTPTMTLQGTGWAKREHSIKLDSPLSQPLSLVSVNNTMKNPASSSVPSVSSISFNRVSYNPSTYSSSNPALVSVEVGLSGAPIDQEATLYANGVLLKRVRDTFGRAIPSGTGTNGLLEESTSVSQANTWMPVSSDSLLLTLDGAMFGQSFPTIQVSAPGQLFDFDNVNNGGGTTVSISGKSFSCVQAPCPLPSLAYRQPTVQQVSVSRWIPETEPLKSLHSAAAPLQPSTHGGNAAINANQLVLAISGIQQAISHIILQNTSETRVVFTASSVSTGTSPTPLPAGTSVQMVTGSTQNLWGNSPEVYVQFGDASEADEYRMKCNPNDGVTTAGNRLVCSVDTKALKDIDPYTKDMHFHILDPGHYGGPLEAWTVQPACTPSAKAPEDCYPPTVWSVSNPVWDGSKWAVSLEFINVTDGAVVNIASSSLAANVSSAKLNCNDKNICKASFLILPSDLPQWQDQMTVTIAGQQDFQWQLQNVKTLLTPTVTAMNPDYTYWNGTNMTGDLTALIIGGNAPIPIQCVNQTTCSVNNKALLPTKTQGVMSLMTKAGATLSLLMVNATGVLTNAIYQPPPATPGAPGGATPSPASPNATITVNVAVQGGKQ